KFDENKRPDLLIKSVKAANLVRKDPLKLLLVGSGPKEEYLKNLAGKDDHIQFVPFQNQTRMPLVYRLGDVFCLPSKLETWGLGVNEAMASKRGIIIGDHVGCKVDLIRSDENGHVFWDSDSLVRLLVDLTKEKSKAFGVSAQQNIKPWNFDAIVEAILASL